MDLLVLDLKVLCYVKFTNVCFLTIWYKSILIRLLRFSESVFESNILYFTPSKANRFQASHLKGQIRLHWIYLSNKKSVSQNVNPFLCKQVWQPHSRSSDSRSHVHIPSQTVNRFPLRCEVGLGKHGVIHCLPTWS